MFSTTFKQSVATLGVVAGLFAGSGTGQRRDDGRQHRP